MSWLRPLGRPVTRHVVLRCCKLHPSTRGPGLLPRRLDSHGIAARVCRLPGRRGLVSEVVGEPATVEHAAHWHTEATKAAKAGRLREASVLYEKAMRARIELLGEFDPETDRTRHSLAATLEVR